MVGASSQDRQRLAEALTKWIEFSGSPNDREIWDAARTASAELGSISARLLADKPLEDAALSSSLTELDGFAETLYHSLDDSEAKRRFIVSLGDVEYRIKRLFGVSARQ